MLSPSLASFLALEANRTSVLEVEDVTKRYLFGPFVLRDLSHRFEPGTATGLVGPNGSGKS
ncbi:MAG: hypothetical protein WBA11_01950, partial [Rubrivirga sp.]